MTCRQPVINNSQAFIMTSAQRSGTGQLVACHFWPMGRVHVAKQVLAASLWYHASFERPLEQLLKQLSRQLRRFVASAQQASHSDDALALAQGNSQGSAQLPSAAISTPPFIKYFLATFASFSGLSAHAEQSRLASRTASDTTDVLEACGSHARQAQFFFFFFWGYRGDVHSMQAARPTKIPDEPMLCETPALSR